jgi:hypothetical protein
LSQIRDPSEGTGASSVCRDLKARRNVQQRVEEVEALDGFFSDVIQVLPKFLRIFFGEYQRGIVSGSGEKDL